MIRARRQARGMSLRACVTCGVRKPAAAPFAFLHAGAMWMEPGGEWGGPHDRMEAFLWLGWHDDDKSQETKTAAVCVFDDVTGGQRELRFCSTACLRSFFSHLVDELERSRTAIGTQEVLLRRTKREGKRRRHTRKVNTDRVSPTQPKQRRSVAAR